jgi:dolichyl-phosphate beta-glucosyltransferase
MKPMVSDKPMNEQTPRTGDIHHVSIVIPAFNEARRLPTSFEAIVTDLAKRPFSWEIVVVDDGSTDGTPSIVEEYAARHPNQSIRLVRAPHLGKGAAVRVGMLAARGAWRFLCDADLSMPIEHLQRFLPPACIGCDVAIGSREAQGSRRIGEPLKRHWMGRVFNAWVRLVALKGISDSQCGFKCFSAAAAEGIFRTQRLDGFAFDVEVLLLARQRGYRVKEVAIDWYYRAESRVQPVRDSWRMFRDVGRVRWNSLRGRYRRVESAPVVALASAPAGRVTDPPTALPATPPPAAPRTAPAPTEGELTRTAR